MNDGSKNDLIFCGRQDCSDMHSWGPGVRTCYIIHYIIRGKGIFMCNGKRRSVKEGQSFVVHPFTEVYYAPDEEDPWEYVWMDLYGEKYKKLLNKIALLENGSIIERIEQNKILPFYTCLLESFYNDRYNTADGIARTILGIYADSYPAQDTDKEDSLFENACLIIEGFYHKPEFGLPVICERLGVSRATLHRCFKKNEGISPGKFLMNFRIQKGCEFLENGSSVKSAAVSCGFENPLYFSKVFSEKTGITPSEYRRRFML